MGTAHLLGIEAGGSYSFAPGRALFSVGPTYEQVRAEGGFCD
jgi:hypothetical protein